MGSEFLFWNSIEIIKAYKSKLISPVEVVNASIKNARKFTQKFNFITEYFEEEAIKKAKISEDVYLGKFECLKA